LGVHVKFLENTGFVASDYTAPDEATGKTNFKAAVDRMKAGKHDPSHADIAAVVLEVDGKEADRYDAPKPKKAATKTDD
jgi:hypothetical protein